MVIAVDIDGVVCDLHIPWLARYNLDFNDTLSKNDITDWEIHKFVKPNCAEYIYRYLDDPTLYDDAPEIANASLGIDTLRRMGHRVVFVTSSVNKVAGRKLNWLREHGFLSTSQTDRVDPDYVECHDKSLVRADILIDDRYENVVDFSGRGILFTQPWNARIENTFRARLTGWGDDIQVGLLCAISVGLKQENCGRKDDTGKARFDLVPAGPLWKLAALYTYGAGKYEDHNWRKGLNWSRTFAALQRHAWCFWRGEDNDEETGLPHMASVAWAAFALIEFADTHPELDDRPGG